MVNVAQFRKTLAKEKDECNSPWGKCPNPFREVGCSVCDDEDDEAMTFMRATIIVMRMSIITTHGGRWC